MSGAEPTAPGEPYDGGYVEDMTVTASLAPTALEPSGADRMLLAALMAGLLALVLPSGTPRRMLWIAVGAAVGAFVLPRFVHAWKRFDGTEAWGVGNPFADGGDKPVFMLTGGEEPA